MNLLLDTHTFLWLVVGSPNLSTVAQTALSDPGNALFLSVVSVWELAIKASSPKQKLKLSDPLDIYIAKWATTYQLILLPIQTTHALTVGQLPHHHRDPFDCLLLAQALVEGMTLVSGDGKFAPYPITILW